MKKVKLGEVTINIDNRRKPLNNLQRIEKSLTKKYPYCGANNIIDFIDEYIFDENEEILCIAEDGGSWGKDEECTYVMNEKCWVNNHAHVLKMKTGVDINYIKLNLDYLDLTSYITGSTRGKLTKSSLEKIELKLPDYHTQISISKRISDIQKLITKKKDQIQKYKELVKSRFNEMFGDPVLNEMGWEKHRLSKLTLKIGSGATPRGGRESYVNEGIALIRSMNVYDGKFIFKDLAYLTNVQAEKLNNVIVESDDVLLNITGASVSRCCIVPQIILPARVNQHVSIIRCKKHLLSPIFLNQLLITSEFKSLLQKIGESSGATRQAITKNQIEELTIPLPPLSLQNEFADFVAQVDKSQFACQKAIKLWRNSLKSSII